MTAEKMTINITPNWEHMRKWVLHVCKTDPDTARNIAEAMGCEAPELPDCHAIDCAIATADGDADDDGVIRVLTPIEEGR